MDSSAHAISEKAITDFNILSITIPEILQLESIHHIDILKMDIEGAEKEIFETNASWLNKVNILIIELHDHYKQGCSKACFKTISEFDFSLHIQGELLIFKNNSI